MSFTWDLQSPKVKLANELREFLKEEMPHVEPDIVRLKIYQIDPDLQRRFIARALLKNLLPI